VTGPVAEEGPPLISLRVRRQWDCMCGQANESPVWRVLDERERPDMLHLDAPGLVVVRCDSCGASATVNDALVLVWSRAVAPLIVVLPGGQDPNSVLDELQAEVGSQILGGPVLVPRVLLPLLLTRDVDADAAAPERAAADVRDGHGDDLGLTYVQFLTLAVEQRAEGEPARLLDSMVVVPREELPEWLAEHPEVCEVAVLDLLDRMAARADAAGDEGSAGLLRLMRNMLAAVAAGTPVAQAFAAHEAAAAEHVDAHMRPELERLWEAANGTDAEAAVLALRELLLRRPQPDGTGERRVAARMLASRLLTAQVGPEGLEEVIGLLEEVRESSPSRDSTWAAATGNLAVAIGERRGGDLVDNWRRAVALLREALTVPDVDEQTLAINETNLGLTLTNRPGGAPQDELDEAIQWLSRGLARRSPDVKVEDWAYSKINLGLAHRRRNRLGDLDEACFHYGEAVGRLRGTPLTRMLIYAELDLAGGLLAAHPPKSLEALPVASAAVGRAEELDDAFLLSWALRMQGDAYAAAEGPQAPAAVGSWQRSVEVLEVTVHPAELLRNAGPLAAAYEAVQAWEPLAAVYERMLAAFDVLYAAQATSEARRHVLVAHPRLARWAAYALARTGRTAAAVEALERARTRELDVNTRRDTADLDAVGRQDPGLVDRYRNALAAYRAAATQPPQETQPAEIATGHGDAVARAATLQHVISEIRAIPGFRRFLVEPTAAESLLSAGAGQALYVVSAPAGTYVLRVALGEADAPPHYDAVHVDVTSGDVAGMLFVSETGDPGLILAQAHPDAVWLERALARFETRFLPIVASIADFAAEISPAPSVLVPTGLSGLIPMQSFPIAGSGTTLDDVAEIHLAPSVAVYAASRRRAARPVPPVLVGIADPDQDLPGSRGELEAIGARPGWASRSVAVGTEATLRWLVSHAPNASHLHLACHGRNDIAEPGGSFLLLASGDRLTVPDLVDGIPLRARVATASACQSALFDASVVPDEHVGLAAGLLQAGAACAVVSLWPVSDEATALLMVRFYEFLDARSGGQQPHTQLPQAALRQARLWLRDLTEANRNAYLAERPVLAAALRARGLPAAATRGSRRGPYDAIEHWGAFVAYGC